MIFWIFVLDSVSQLKCTYDKKLQTSTCFVSRKHCRFCRLSNTCSPHCIYPTPFLAFSTSSSFYPTAGPADSSVSDIPSRCSAQFTFQSHSSLNALQGNPALTSDSVTSSPKRQLKSSLPDCPRWPRLTLLRFHC